MQRHQYFTNTYRRKEPGEWGVGRIYQTRGGPDSLRWFWSLTVNGPMTRNRPIRFREKSPAGGG